MEPLSELFEVASAAGVSLIPVRGSTMRVGRAVDNDIVLGQERTVSRRHAQFEQREDTWVVSDLGSHNGTFVNGERLRAGEERTIGAGDVVGVGDATIRLAGAAHDDGQTVQDSSAQSIHELLTALSAREREVLALVAEGRTDDQVAASLFISTKTVHSHLDRIRDKTGLRRRAELTRLAVRLGLRGSPAAD